MMTAITEFQKISTVRMRKVSERTEIRSRVEKLRSWYTPTMLL